MIVAEYVIAGRVVREHVVHAPLDHDDPDGPTIEVFAREVVLHERRNEALPLLLFLQGGPGGAGPEPVPGPSWLTAALERFRVVLLDQRGTGRSTRVDAARALALGDAAADYLAHFRADAIVGDAEALRAADFDGARWCTLGQSFGGFITLAYLSRAPQALAACAVTGGLAGLTADAAEVYRRTYPRAAAKNREFRVRYPHDSAVLDTIADAIAAGAVALPGGETLSVRRLQLLGMDFGMSTGFDALHWQLDAAIGSDGLPSEAFLEHLRHRTAFAEDPLYVVLQEACYGAPGAPTGWAASAEHERHPAFAADARPLLCTGEMVFPWMFEEIGALRPFQRAAETLAAKTDWPALYDLAQLADNEVPVEAAVYFDDLYVDAGLQLETAQTVGNLHAWVTNEYEHDGVRSGERVFRRLFQLLDDRGAALS